MPIIRWQDLSDIKHNIQNSLVKIASIEIHSKALLEEAHKMKAEIIAELEKYNLIIERIPDDDKSEKTVIKERRNDRICESDS